MRTNVGDVMSRRVTCVAPDASWTSIEELLLEHDNEALVVTDDLSRPLGLVSKTDLLRGLHVDDARGSANEIMTPVANAILETAPLSFALAALGQKRVERAPVVRADGAIVGMLSATDAVRWMAREFGYECD
jgi:CBS-domain-containing membrane protein